MIVITIGLPHGFLADGAETLLESVYFLPHLFGQIKDVKEAFGAGREFHFVLYIVPHSGRKSKLKISENRT